MKSGNNDETKIELKCEKLKVLKMTFDENKLKKYFENSYFEMKFVVHAVDFTENFEFSERYY